MNKSNFYREIYNTCKLSFEEIRKHDRTLGVLSLSVCIIQALLPYLYPISISLTLIFLYKSMYDTSILCVILCMSLIFLVGVVRSGLMAILEYKCRKIDKTIELDIYGKILSLDFETFSNPAFLRKANSALTSMRYTGGFGQLVRFLQQIVNGIISLIYGLSIVLLNLSTINFPGNLIDLICIWGMIALLLIIIEQTYHRSSKIRTKKRDDIFNEILKDEKRLNYFLFSVFVAYDKAESIRIFNMEEFILKSYKRYHGQALENNMTHYYYTGSQTVLGQINSGLVMVLVNIGFIITALCGGIEMALLPLLISSISNIARAISTITDNKNYLDSQLSKVKNISSFVPCEKKHIQVMPKLLQGEEEYIQFHNVSYKYPNGNSYALRNINETFVLKKGAVVSIVGKNGAGKSTFIGLLLGIIKPTEGYITFNGVNINKIPEEKYLDNFGVVMQEFALYALPLWENIATDNTCNLEKVYKAAQKAGLLRRDKTNKTIYTPLYTYDMLGVNFSGGEEQKIAFARAIYKTKPILILDEPTAALDPASEHELYSIFSNQSSEAITFMVSHRMSSCKISDEILLFSNGSISGRGPHEELLKNNALYEELWKVQADAYLT